MKHKSKFLCQKEEWKVPLPMKRGWNWMIFKLLAAQTILWLYEIITFLNTTSSNLVRHHFFNYQPGKFWIFMWKTHEKELPLAKSPLHALLLTLTSSQEAPCAPEWVVEPRARAEPSSCSHPLGRMWFTRAAPQHILPSPQITRSWQSCWPWVIISCHHTDLPLLGSNLKSHWSFERLNPPRISRFPPL